MKKISLKRLLLRDFQGATYELLADGEATDIYAANGVGKTRLFSAFTYLLFGKDSLNRSDFSLKNLNADGEVAEHGIQHTVEGVLDVDGEEVTLKKVYSEKFVKARGNPIAEFTGHSTQHFINDVPHAEKDYKAYIHELAGDEQTFRLLTSPTAFPQLPWQKQRAILLEIFKDVSDEDIIASEPKLAGLPKILGRHKVEDYKKILAARQSELTKSLGTSKQPGTIETRIDEVRRGLPDITGLAQKALGAQIADYETATNEAKLKLRGVDTGSGIAELSKRLAVVNVDLQRMENAHFSETVQTINRLNQEITEREAKVKAAGRRVVEITERVEAKKRIISDIDKKLIRLREDWATADAQVFQDTTAQECAACGQPLPVNRVQEAREKAFGAFNVRKSEQLTDIEERGRRSAEEKDHLLAEIETLLTERETIQTPRETKEPDLETLIKDRDLAREFSHDFTSIPGRADLLTQKADIEEQIKVEKEGHAQDAEKVREEIFALEHLLAASKADADKFTRRTAGEVRIEELKAEEKKLAVEAERIASELFLIDLFTQIKVDMLNEKMTGHFEFVKWKLAEIQVNGAVNDQMCELTINGIPYSGGLNSAARIQGGCDIVRTLQKHFQLSAPLWLDNRESVTEIPPMQCQVISLIVSPNDKALRVVHSRSFAHAAA